MLEDFEEDLARNVVRIVANDHERTLANDCVEIEAKEVALDHMELWVMLAKIDYRLGVDFDGCEVDIGVLQKKLCEHTHARTNLDDTSWLGCR